MKRLCVSALVVAAVLLPVSTAAAVRLQTITFMVDPMAVATADGTSLTVRVTVACPANYEVLEAFVYVSQGVVSSQNFPTPIPLTCRPKGQEYTLTVTAPEGQAWAAGEASLSGYVLVEHKLETLTTSPTALLDIVLR